MISPDFRRPGDLRVDRPVGERGLRHEHEDDGRDERGDTADDPDGEVPRERTRGPFGRTGGGGDTVQQRDAEDARGDRPAHGLHRVGETRRDTGLRRGRGRCGGSGESRDQRAGAEAHDDHVRDDLTVGVMERQEQQEAEADEDRGTHQRDPWCRHRAMVGKSSAPAIIATRYTPMMREVANPLVPRP